MGTSGKPSRERILSVVAATAISLGCGTNYVFSAWAPQFAQQLKLSSTEINLVGTFGNLGMYLPGIPLGMMIDAKGPRWGVVVGTLLFAFGYYPLAKAFDAGPGVYSVPTLCLFSFFTGAGSSAAFSASIKTAALNFPEARGSATSFPLAAFGLSAFAFSAVALALPHDTSHFLLLLAIGTVALPIVSFPFLRVLPTTPYAKLPHHETQSLHRAKVAGDRSRLGTPDTGAQADSPNHKFHPSSSSSSVFVADGEETSETSSLLSTSTTSSTHMADLEVCKSIESDGGAGQPHPDIRGFALVSHLEFWQLFSMLGLFCGMGLMTINNLGNDAQALWRHYDPSVDAAFIAKRQAMHVSIISVLSFSGRLLSGIGSDILVSKYNQSRLWCLFVSGCGFIVAQALGYSISNPIFLVTVSGITGLSYGILFGVYPSLVAHAFGVGGLSQNWGTMTLAPVISGNIFNILYGRVYDSHSIVRDNGDRECLEGRHCYSTAYLVTIFASAAGILLCLWTIYYEGQVHSNTHRKDVRERRKSDHERIA